MIASIRLPRLIQRRLESASQEWLYITPAAAIDFSKPAGEEALASAHSVSWRIFKNPVALLIGGIAAVVLELALPAVRAGVWEHSNFRVDPLRRMRRTGLAAMTTVYGPRSIAEPMIARVVRMHSAVAGLTTSGVSYSANDAELLTWVHATAAYGFASAYSRYVGVLDSAQLDDYYTEGLAASRLYGAVHAPVSGEEALGLIASMESRLEPSPVIALFLRIMGEVPALPGSLRWLQPSLLRAAIELIPDSIRHRLELDDSFGPSSTDRLLAKAAGSVADRIPLHGSPAVQSCLRLGLPPHHLYR